ncbi:MAG: PAS domain-containing protein [Candidatus Thermoplasmatota archaeon]|nr:PAS domain-containing protein [Candidatus Thermoplasmatota archaeon]
MKILLVDDERGLLEQAKTFLKKTEWEFDVDTATSAGKALEMLEDEDYEAIISDYQMPEMDGLDFLETLRRDRKSEIPFIIFTGKGREEVAMEALNLGADRYLQKGGDPKSQYDVLAQAIYQEVGHFRAKERIRSLTRDLQETFDTMSDPMFILDDEHKILKINKAAEEFFGEEQGDILGEHCHKIAHGRDEPLENCPLEKCLESKKIEEISFYHEGLDRYFIARTNPILDEKGDIKKMIHQEIDVTEIKRKKEELKESKMLFESIFQDPSSFIRILDLDGRIIQADKTSLQFIGSSREELEGKLFWETPWWEHSEELQERVKEGIEKARDGERVRFKALHHGEDEEKVKVDFTIQPVRDEEGEIKKLLAHGRDISSL